MSNEIIQSVTYDNYDDFQHINVIFSQNFISLFLGLFNDETDLRIRYFNLWCAQKKYDCVYGRSAATSLKSIE
jgi:hypothetical protein